MKKQYPDTDTQAILARREAFIKQMLSDDEMEGVKGGAILSDPKPCLTIIGPIPCLTIDPKPCLTIVPGPGICLSILPPEDSN
jgi:hypothetical protein